MAEAIDAAIDALVQNLQTISGLTVLTEWPTSNQKLNYPSVTVVAGRDKRQPLANPEQIAATAPNAQNQITVTYVVAEYDIPIQMDLWAANKAQRRQFLDSILALFRAGYVNDIYNDNTPDGMSLQLTNYFNVFARYEIDTHEFRDDEMAAERQERRCRISLLANVSEVVQKTQYAIVHVAVAQGTSYQDEALTDDNANTEQRNIF